MGNQWSNGCCVATGVGGVAGGALICAGANSIIGSYVSEATGGSSVAGWVGGMVTGAVNCLSGIGAGIGSAIQGMPAISTTTTTVANSLNAAWSLVSETVCDFLGTVSSLLS